ncbi:MAG: hypothetical protein ACNA7O_14325 [Rhodobacterales bacterium]
MSKNENLRRQIEGRHFTRATDATVAPLAEIIDTAQRQLGYDAHTPIGAQDVTWTRKKIAGTNGTLSLRSLLPEINGTPSRPSSAATIRPAGEQMTIGQAVLMNSRVAMAGAAVIALPEQRLIDGTAPALAEVPAGMRVINPAPFGAIVETLGEGQVTASVLADIITEAALDRSAMTQRAFRVPLPRSAMRDIGEAQLTAEALHAIALGLGRAVDAQLLAAIVAATPAVYTNQPVGTASTAAARGLRWQDLAAIVGTAGAGATVDGGQLYVGGVPAELSADMTQTLVGAWDRFGVVVSPEIEVLAERIDATGGVTLTCWCDMQALIPDLGNVWAVGA